jgi:hypothetical protein
MPLGLMPDEHKFGTVENLVLLRMHLKEAKSEDAGGNYAVRCSAICICHNFFVRRIKPGNDDGHVARLGEVRIACKILVRRSEKKKGRNLLNISIDARIILKRLLMK